VGFDGKVVMVTGAAKGIGLAIAQAFAREGARVAALDVDDEALKRAADTLAGEVLALRADVTRSPDVRAAAEATLARWGRVDVLVNNAGGFAAIRLTEDIPEEEWDAILRMNVTSAFLCTKAVLPSMKAAKAGRIVNLSSIGGRGGAIVLSSHYTAAKAAILGFTRQLARETAPFGITVNAVAPGTTATERFRSLRTAEETRALAETVPVRRVAEPSEIAACVLFLASDAASYVTGACLDVNGGLLMV
jgi:NAD(P)-dependent dehydrogenase (short-subunit alcohol dehydrogenase family)